MHPELMQQAFQAHVQDLHREAAAQQRRVALLGRRRPLDVRLSAAVHDVLLFAEHDPTRREVARVLEGLTDLRDDVVTAVLHHRPGTALRRDVRSRTARDHLEELLEALRTAGHRVTGEVTSGSVEQVLTSAVRQRRPDAVVLLPGRHLLAHLAHRDLERALRRHTPVPVLAVVGGGAPHLV